MSIGTVKETRPRSVELAFWLWIGALAAGVAEMVQRWDDGGIVLRLGIYAVLALVMALMRAGANWARLLLAIGLGVFGTLSLVIEPISAVLGGEALGAVLGEAGVFRGLHLLCVLAALPLMFTPRAEAYFTGSTARITTQ